MVERCPDKTEVGGSIPPSPTIIKISIADGYFYYVRAWIELSRDEVRDWFACDAAPPEGWKYNKIPMCGERRDPL